MANFLGANMIHFKMLVVVVVICFNVQKDIMDGFSTRYTPKDIK
jgi:hypothetical protein